MIKIYNYLTWEIISKYGDRKKPGYMSIITNTENNEVYVVPRDMEHISFICKLFSADARDVAENPDRFSHLVPSVLWIADDEVKSLATGFSSVESRFNVRHTEEQFNRAHARAMKFIDDGEIPKSPYFEHAIVKRYIKK